MMNSADQLFKKIETMPLEKLLTLCALAIEEKMEKKRTEALLLMLETRLQKYRMLSQLGIKPQ